MVKQPQLLTDDELIDFLVDIFHLILNSSHLIRSHSTLATLELDLHQRHVADMVAVFHTSRW